MPRTPRVCQHGTITLVIVTALVVLALAATVSGLWTWPPAAPSACPKLLEGPGHQCLLLNAPVIAPKSDWNLQVWAMRDVRQHPHVVQLLAQAEDLSTHAQAWLSQSLQLPILGLAGTGSVPPIALDECPGNSSTPTWWPALLGNITPEQLQAWSNLQQQAGLSPSSTVSRQVYWVSQPGDWLAPLGSAAHPVLLVFDAAACTPQCPALQAPVYGTVLYLAQCHKTAITAMATAGAMVQGQVAVQANVAPPGLSVQGAAQVRSVYALAHVSNSSAQVQWVPGSWQDATP